MTSLRNMSVLRQKPWKQNWGATFSLSFITCFGRYLRLYTGKLHDSLTLSWGKLISNIIWSMINNLPATCSNISDTKDTKIILQASCDDAKNSSSGCAVQLFNIQFCFAGGAPAGTGWLTLTCGFFGRFRAWNLDVTNVQWSQSWSLKVSYRSWIFNMVFCNRHLYLHNANNVSLNLLLVYSDVCSCIIVASVYWVLLF